MEAHNSDTSISSNSSVGITKRVVIAANGSVGIIVLVVQIGIVIIVTIVV